MSFILLYRKEFCEGCSGLFYAVDGDVYCAVDFDEGDDGFVGELDFLELDVVDVAVDEDAGHGGVVFEVLEHVGFAFVEVGLDGVAAAFLDFLEDVAGHEPVCCSG